MEVMKQVQHDSACVGSTATIGHNGSFLIGKWFHKNEQ